MPSKLVWERVSDMGLFFLVPGGKIWQISSLLSQKTFLKARFLGTFHRMEKSRMCNHHALLIN